MPRQRHLHGLRGPCTLLKCPDKDLLTLYPDVPRELEVKVGIHASPQYQARLDRKKQGEQEELGGHLAIAATPLDGLQVGGRYQIVLRKDIAGEFPGCVWWWDWGERDEVVRRMTRSAEDVEGYVVPVLDGFSGEGKQIRVELIGDGPVLEVED